jgi:hypothetical protein
MLVPLLLWRLWRLLWRLLWRVYRKPRPLMRRSSDWLGATQPLTRDEQQQVAGGTKQ